MVQTHIIWYSHILQLGYSRNSRISLGEIDIWKNVVLRERGEGRFLKNVKNGNRNNTWKTSLPTCRAKYFLLCHILDAQFIFCLILEKLKPYKERFLRSKLFLVRSPTRWCTRMLTENSVQYGKIFKNSVKIGIAIFFVTPKILSYKICSENR